MYGLDLDYCWHERVILFFFWSFPSKLISQVLQSHSSLLRLWHPQIMPVHPLGHPSIHQHRLTRIPLQRPLTVGHPPPKLHQPRHKLTTGRQGRPPALLLRTPQPSSHPIKPFHPHLQSSQRQMSSKTPPLKQRAQVRLPQSRDHILKGIRHRVSDRFSPHLRATCCFIQQQKYRKYIFKVSLFDHKGAELFQNQARPLTNRREVPFRPHSARTYVANMQQTLEERHLREQKILNSMHFLIILNILLF